MKMELTLAVFGLLLGLGRCAPADSCISICPYSLSPVCGSDGFTYPSECELRRVDCLRRGVVRLTLAYTGSCKCDEVACVQSLISVCGKDGRTYADSCALKQAECRPGLSSSEAEIQKSLDTFTNHSSDKIGFNGLYLQNISLVGSYDTLQEKEIGVANMGPCA